MKPGASTRPPASTTRRAPSRTRPMRAMRPPCTARSAENGGMPVPSTTRASRISRSKAMARILPSMRASVSLQPALLVKLPVVVCAPPYLLGALSGGAVQFALFYEIPVPRPWSPSAEYEAYQHTIEQAVFGEQMGFRAFWTVEHHFLE